MGVHRLSKSNLSCTKTSFHLYTNYPSLNYLAKIVSQLPFSVCLHFYPFSITSAKKSRPPSPSWQDRRTDRQKKEGIIPPTQWQPIWQNNHCLAVAIWYFTRGRELYMKCQGKHWLWQADHWGNPLLGSDNGATHGASRISLRLSLNTLGVWGWWYDCEWCEWWLWRWMTVSRAKPKPQGAHGDLIHHLQICLPSPRAKINPSASAIVPSGAALLYRRLQRDVQIDCNFIVLIPS